MTLCIPVGYAISFIALSIITLFIGDYIYVNGVQHITEDYLGLYIIVPMIDLLVGLVRYGMLRPYLPRMGGGWLVGLLLVAVSYRLRWIDPARNFEAVFLLMGLSIGAAQWLLLRKRVPRAAWWIIASLIGWGLVAIIQTGNTIGQYDLLIVGFFPACATAGMLALLLNGSNDSTISRSP